MFPDGEANWASATVGRALRCGVGGEVCVVDDPVVLAAVAPAVVVAGVEVVALAGVVPDVVGSERVTVTIVFDDPHPATRAAASTTRSAPRITAAAYPRSGTVIPGAEHRGGVASPP
jgi:hypothetical protein